MDQEVPHRGRCKLQQSAIYICRSTWACIQSKITDLVIADSFQYPLDSVKTRLQAYARPPTSPTPRLTSHSYKFNSFADCVRHTYKTEGFHGFYRGKLRPSQLRIHHMLMYAS